MIIMMYIIIYYIPCSVAVKHHGIHDHGPIMSTLILALIDDKNSPYRTVQVLPKDIPGYDI